MQHFSAGLPPEVYFGGMRIARRDPNGTVYYFLADRLGNARVLTDSSGSVVEESDYYPYGLERVVTGSGALNNYKYTGHERDTKSGLDHTLHRQLSSAQARWLSPDRARGKVINPQSWNRYSYGGNNPCNNVDPDGAFYGEVAPPPDFTRFILESWDPFGGYDLFDLLSGLTGPGPFIPSPTSAFKELSDMVGEDCAKGLAKKATDKAGNLSVDTAITLYNRASAQRNILIAAASGFANIDWRMLAAVGILESNFLPIMQKLDDGSIGPARGVFQIEYERQGITEACAMDLACAGLWAAGHLAGNMAYFAWRFDFDRTHLLQATAASWNLGRGGISGNPDTIDKGSNPNGTYGQDILNLMECFDDRSP